MEIQPQEHSRYYLPESTQRHLKRTGKTYTDYEAAHLANFQQESKRLVLLLPSGGVTRVADGTAAAGRGVSDDPSPQLLNNAVSTMAQIAG